MRIAAKRILWLIVSVTISLGAFPAQGSSSYKCKQPACDISAIGHRKLVTIPSVGDWYSLEREKRLGDKDAATVEQRVEFVADEAVTSYVDRIAQHITKNSDSDMPITVRIIERSDASAFSLFGGHLYLTTGLLLRLRSEAELASVLARGIAHTALHSVARLQTRAALLQAAGIPMIGVDSPPPAPGANDVAALLGSLKFQRGFELEADYFGIQYVYKSGYDTNCFLRAIQTVWQPDPGSQQVRAFSPFPPLEDRMKMLRQEIDDILPKRPGDIVSTSEFESFMERLRQITPPDSPSKKDVLPRLIRHDPATSN